MPTPPLQRRALLRAAAAGLLATACGCSAARPDEPPLPSTRSSRGPSSPEPGTLPSPSPAPALPAVARWTPSPRETLPALKSAASDLAQALCTRRPGQAVDDALEAAGPLLAPSFVVPAGLAVLGEGTASTGAVVYPQFGGLSPLGADARQSSVMVVVRQSLLSRGGAVTTVTRTLDVRLSRDGDRWQVTGVPDLGGEPVDRPRDLPPAAVRVLDDPRIALPDSARWDVHRGAVSPALLEVLSAAAELGDVGVTVLATGHPREVFGTDRLSAHTVGRAVDVWRLGTTAVVDDRSPGGPAAQVQAQALLDRRVSQVGSPPGTDQDGAGRRSFDDLVHEDHLHLAVRR